jgi:hypothetical protein
MGCSNGLQPRPDVEGDQRSVVDSPGAIDELLGVAAVVEQFKHAGQDSSRPRLDAMLTAFQDKHIAAVQAQLVRDGQPGRACPHDDHIGVHQDLILLIALAAAIVSATKLTIQVG